MSVEYAASAQRDLRAIHSFIAADDERAADRWIRKLMTAADVAAVNPLAGRVVPEWGNATIREVFVRSYRVIYRAKGRRIVVLRVIEGHMRLRGRRR